MKIRNLILSAVAMFAAVQAGAAIKPYYQDTKFPTQQMIEKQSFTNPIAASVSYVVFQTAGGTSAAAASLSSFSNQPDVPRNLVVAMSGSTASVTCVVTVSGTNFLDQSISETFTFSAVTNGTVTGNNAFKTISSVSWPVSCESGAFSHVWSVGVGEKLGLKRCTDAPGHILFSTLDSGSGFGKEATGPTMANAVASVHGNTADFVGTMNGSNDFELFFIQNFRCLP